MAQVSEVCTITPRALTNLETVEPGAIVVSRHGTLAAADVTVGDEVLTAVSLYGGWERPVAGGRPIFADAAVHRLLSDLAGIVTAPRSHRVIAAGDLNILHAYGEHGDTYWGRRYATVLDRAEGMGLQLVGPQAPHGRQADPPPAELPDGSADVPTYHTRVQGPEGATRQLDFVFASRSVADRVTARALDADAGEWGPSDHCRIAIEADL